MPIRDFQEVTTSVDPGKVSAKEIEEAKKIKDIAMQLKEEETSIPNVPIENDNLLTQQT